MDSLRADDTVLLLSAVLQGFTQYVCARIGMNTPWGKTRDTMWSDESRTVPAAKVILPASIGDSNGRIFA